MNKHQYGTVMATIALVGVLIPTASLAQRRITAEESPVNSECSARVNITPTNTRPQSAYGTTLYDYRVDVSTDTKECAVVGFRVYAVPPQADGKVVLDGEEPTTVSVYGGRESVEDSLQVHSMSRKIPLNVDNVSCKLCVAAGRTQESTQAQERHTGSGRERGTIVTPKEACPKIGCICNDDTWLDISPFDGTTGRCLPASPSFCNEPCTRRDGWSGLAYSPDATVASQEECPEEMCTCRNQMTRQVKVAKETRSGAICAPRPIVCRVACETDGGWAGN